LAGQDRVQECTEELTMKNAVQKKRERERGASQRADHGEEPHGGDGGRPRRERRVQTIPAARTAATGLKQLARRRRSYLHKQLGGDGSTTTNFDGR
jgi:hypothetical protein